MLGREPDPPSPSAEGSGEPHLPSTDGSDEPDYRRMSTRELRRHARSQHGFDFFELLDIECLPETFGGSWLGFQRRNKFDESCPSNTNSTGLLLVRARLYSS